ncbi:MAG: hypothetical protein RL348_1112 [Bacteroidota bacterium]|jgi:hypothetical protein
MKKLLKIGVSVLLFVTVPSTFAFSQFTQATINEVSFGLTVNGRATGNDILDKTGDTWEVTVWEDPYYNSPGLGFRYFPSVGSPITNAISLAFSDAEDPDVGLTVDSNGDIHAIVVYFSDSQDNYYVEDYIWNSTTFSLNSGPTSFDSQTNFGTAVNIDTDYDGYFVVVWDVSGAPYGITGDVVNGSLNLNTSSGIGSIGPGIFPDVCLSSQSNDQVYYCFLDNGNLYVENDSYSSLSSGTSSATNINSYSPTSTFSFATPRIGCPNPNTGNSSDWAMVVSERKTGGPYNILFFANDNSNGLVGPINCNDGSWWSSSGPDITSVDNYSPVVTYDDQGNIFVGWNMDNTGNPLVSLSPTWASIYPVVLLCDFNGPVTNAPYWEVPANGNDGEVRDYLSLAGKNGNDVLVCSYYYNDGSDVETKSITNSVGIPGLRVWPDTPTESNFSNFINGFQGSNEVLKFELYDITGRLISTFNSTIDSEKTDLKSIFNEPHGFLNQLFILTISSKNEFLFRSTIMR